MLRQIVALIILNALISTSFAQQGLWMASYSYDSNSTRLRNEGNRWFIHVTKDSVFTFDAGKEKWEGKLVNGFSYSTKGKGFFSNDERLQGEVYFELTDKGTIQVSMGDKTIVFNKIGTSKIGLSKDKVSDFIFDGFFTRSSERQATDTVSFYNNKYSTEYELLNIPAEIFSIGHTAFLHSGKAFIRSSASIRQRSRWEPMEQSNAVSSTPASASPVQRKRKKNY
jgi:hypothetical protein